MLSSIGQGGDGPAASRTKKGHHSPEYRRDAKCCRFALSSRIPVPNQLSSAAPHLSMVLSSHINMSAHDAEMDGWAMSLLDAQQLFMATLQLLPKLPLNLPV